VTLANRALSAFLAKIDQRDRSGMGHAGATHPNCGVYRSLQAALLGALLAVGAVTSDAQSPVKQALVLQSLERGVAVTAAWDGMTIEL
jgi:hypothetical protein